MSDQGLADGRRRYFVAFERFKQTLTSGCNAYLSLIVIVAYLDGVSARFSSLGVGDSKARTWLGLIC